MIQKYTEVLQSLSSFDVLQSIYSRMFHLPTGPAWLPEGTFVVWMVESMRLVTSCSLSHLPSTFLRIMGFCNALCVSHNIPNVRPMNVCVSNESSSFSPLLCHMPRGAGGGGLGDGLS